MTPAAALRAAMAAIAESDFDTAQRLLDADAAPLARARGPHQARYYRTQAQLALRDDRFDEADALAGAAERTVRLEEEPTTWLTARTLRAEIALCSGHPLQAQRLIDPALDAVDASFDARPPAAAGLLIAAAIAHHERGAAALADAALADARALGGESADLRRAEHYLAGQTGDDIPALPCPTHRRDWAELVRARRLARDGELAAATAAVERFVDRAQRRPLCAVQGWLARAEIGVAAHDATARDTALTEAIRIATPGHLVGPFAGHPDLRDAAAELARQAGATVLAEALASDVGVTAPR